MSEVHLRQDYIQDLRIGQTYNFIFDGSLSEGEAYKVELELYDYSDPFGTLVRYEIAKLQTGLGTERPISIRISPEIINLAPFHQRLNTRFRYVVTVYTVELSPTIISVWKSDNDAIMPRNTISGTFVYIQQNTIMDLEIDKTYGFQFAGELDANEAYKVELELFDYLNPDSEMRRYEIIRGQVMPNRTININIPKAISFLEAFQERSNTRFRYVVTVYALTQQQEVIIVWKSDNDAIMPRNTITIPHYQIDNSKIQYIISHTNVEPQPYYDTLGRRWHNTIENITPIETNIEHNLTAEDLYGGELQCEIEYRTPNTFCYRGSATATESGFNYVSEYSPTSPLPESQTLVVHVILYDARFGAFEPIAEYNATTNLTITRYPNPIITNNSTVIRVDQNGAPSSVGTYGVIDIDQSWIRLYDATLLPPEDISLDNNFALSFTSIPGGEYYDVYIDDDLYVSIEDSEYEPIVAISNDAEIKYLFKEKEAGPDTYKTGTYTSTGMVKDGYTQLQPSPSGAPDWLPDTYYRKQTYQDAVLGTIDYYWLLTEEPSDWGNNYTNYYEASIAFFNTTSDYTFDVTITDTFGLTYTKQLVLEKQNIFMHFGPRGIGLGVGELAETEKVSERLQGKPYITTPWGYKGTSYYRKVGNKQREIRENFVVSSYGGSIGDTGTILLVSVRDGLPITIEETNERYPFERLTAPTPWISPDSYDPTNDDNAFYHVVGSNFEQVLSATEPSDWESNYSNYYKIGYKNLFANPVQISEPGLYFIDGFVQINNRYNINKNQVAGNVAFWKIRMDVVPDNPDTASFTYFIPSPLRTYARTPTPSFETDNMRVSGWINAQEGVSDTNHLTIKLGAAYHSTGDTAYSDASSGLPVINYYIRIVRTDGLLSGYSN